MRSPFVGRTDELARLQALATPAIVYLEGPAGVGKSRLVREFVSGETVRSHEILVGHCRPVGAPLGPVAEALADIAHFPDIDRLTPLVGALRTLLPEFADHLPPALDGLGSTDADDHRLFRALAELLAALGPAVLVVEDVHWADPRTLAFLDHLAVKLPRHLTVLCTARSEDTDPVTIPAAILDRPPPGTTHLRLTLGPLDRHDTGRLATALVGADSMPPDFVHSLHQRTGGSPFAVEQVAALIRETPTDEDAAGGWEPAMLDRVGVPAAVGDAVARRLAALPPAATDVLRALAVLRTPCSAPELAQLCDLSEVELRSGLAAALKVALVEELPDRRVGIAHELTRMAVHQRIPAPERAWRHARAAEVLAQADPPRHAERFAHLREAGDRDAALDAAEAAAAQAEDRGDPAAAAELLGHALELGSAGPERTSQLMLDYARNALYGRLHADAVARVAAHLETGVLTPIQRGELQVHLAWLLVQSGDTAAASPHMRRALEELGDDAPALAARAEAYLAHPWVDDAPLDQKLPRLDRALDLARRSGDPAAIETAQCARLEVLSTIGDPRAFDDPPPDPGTATGAARPRSLLLAQFNVAQNCIHLGHDARARAHLDAARRIAEEVQDNWLAGALDSTDAILAHRAGDWDGLDERAAGLIDRHGGIPADVVDLIVVRAGILLARGELEDAAATAESGRSLAAELGAAPLEAEAAAALARMRLAEGCADDAVDTVAGVLDAIAATGVWVWCAPVLPVATAAFLAAGQRERAEQVLRAAAEGVEDRDAPAAAAAVAWSRALLAGDTDAAGPRFAGAARSYEDIGRPHPLARVREQHGTWHLRRGEPDRGAELLEQALSAYAALGASWDGARACAVLREHGLPVPHPWRGGRRAYGDELSPREREVAGLAAAGLTNREIAERLFLSPRTVEYHVSNAMRKVGAESRHELPSDP